MTGCFGDGRVFAENAAGARKTLYAGAGYKTCRCRIQVFLFLCLRRKVFYSVGYCPAGRTGGKRQSGDKALSFRGWNCASLETLSCYRIHLAQNGNNQFINIFVRRY